MQIYVEQWAPDNAIVSIRNTLGLSSVCFATVFVPKLKFGKLGLMCPESKMATKDFNKNFARWNELYSYTNCTKSLFNALKSIIHSLELYHYRWDYYTLHWNLEWKTKSVCFPLHPRSPRCPLWSWRVCLCGTARLVSLAPTDATTTTTARWEMTRSAVVRNYVLLTTGMRFLRGSADFRGFWHS